MAGAGSPCLVVFARAPVPGQVKTRLCQPGPESAPGAALTPEQAARLHAAFVADVCRSGAQSGIRSRRLYVAGDKNHPELQQLAGEHGYSLCEQRGGDLGARMDAAITAELGKGASSVVLIGTDSPTLPTGYLQRAAQWLEGEVEVVLGPAADGGYYLVGARRSIPELFASGIAWGTAQVLPATLLRLQSLRAGGAGVGLLPFFYDVDTPQDLRLLAAHLHLTGPGRAGRGTDNDAARESLTDLQAPETYVALQSLGWLRAD